jgi:hypothetical protein
MTHRFIAEVRIRIRLSDFVEILSPALFEEFDKLIFEEIWRNDILTQYLKDDIFSNFKHANPDLVLIFEKEATPNLTYSKVLIDILNIRLKYAIATYQTLWPRLRLVGSF